MASEVTVRKLTQGFMVSTPRTMRDGVPVEEAFAESTRPAMIQRVLRCLGIEPHEAYLPTVEGDEIPGYRCANGACGIDD